MIGECNRAGLVGSSGALYTARMHGQQETTQTPRLLLAVTNLLLLLIAGWLYLPAGSAWIGRQLWDVQGAGDPARRLVLWLFGLIFWGRLLVTGFVLLRRRFDWSEFGGVVFACVVYQVGFALLGTASARPIGAWDVLGIGLFLVGGAVNTGSEYQRRRFKDRPINQGKLYRQGLFRYVRHVNYLGDVLWVLGWALLTARGWSLLIPLLLTAGFIFFFIPDLSRHLRERYGQAYEQWTQESWALIPFVY